MRKGSLRQSAKRIWFWLESRRLSTMDDLVDGEVEEKPLDRNAVINAVLEGCASHLEKKAAEWNEKGEQYLSPCDDPYSFVAEILRAEAKTIRESKAKYDEVRVIETDEDKQFTLTNSEMMGCSRRFKILPMPPDMLFTMRFNCLAGRDKETFHKIMALVIEGIPTDVRIEGIAYDPKYKVILLRLHSSIWSVIESSDIPILKWGSDVLLTTKNLLLQPYTSNDLLEMMNEARSKLGLDHLSFNWSERPIWLRDLLLLEGDTPKDKDTVQFNMPSPNAQEVVGEVSVGRVNVLLKLVQDYGEACEEYEHGNTGAEERKKFLFTRIQEQLGE